MAITAWAAKFLTNSICFSIKRFHLLAINGNRAHRLTFFEHRDHKDCSNSRDVGRAHWEWVAFDIHRSGTHVGFLDRLSRSRCTRKRYLGTGPIQGTTAPLLHKGSR